MPWKIKNPNTESIVKALFTTELAYQQALDDACEDSRYRGKSFVKIINHSFNSATRRHFALELDWTDVEKTAEYDANNWNEYPKVQPPKHTWMRVEYPDGQGYKAQYDGKLWSCPDCRILVKDPARFRPWED